MYYSRFPRRWPPCFSAAGFPHLERSGFTPIYFIHPKLPVGGRVSSFHITSINGCRTGEVDKVLIDGGSGENPRLLGFATGLSSSLPITELLMPFFESTCSSHAGVIVAYDGVLVVLHHLGRRTTYCRRIQRVSDKD
ncbi:hypothetical protein BHE74_00057485 [Ensete ventricosum]|nr:hypothetical protein BHE74_00057485 [Ensete ventricosum]